MCSRILILLVCLILNLWVFLKHLHTKCEKLYYCQSELENPEGLTLISNELQYQEFIDIAYRCGVQPTINMEGVTYEGVSRANGNQDATKGENLIDDEDDNVPDVEDSNVLDVKGKPMFNEDLPWKKQ
uniref:Uncharacterized protein n=1 Tax=Lactuca sativa TaxID=4236 RepID=A0A9R1XE12_LACSA|nr:hypothetical protein LSAT_V11C400194650 [Lactuca sativa]